MSCPGSVRSRADQPALAFGGVNRRIVGLAFYGWMKQRIDQCVRLVDEHLLLRLPREQQWDGKTRAGGREDDRLGHEKLLSR